VSVTQLMRAAAVCVLVSAAGCTAANQQAASPALNEIDTARLRSIVEAAAAELKVPGAVVSLHTPQGSFDVAVGTTDVAATRPPDVHTRFRIASNTKTMTAALIVLLAQDDKLALEDPVSRYVADVPNGANITIEELLKMRSGLYGYTGDLALSEELDRDPARSYTPADVLAIAYRHPPLFAPGSAFDYSNTNYALLGLVAEKVGGTALSAQFHDRLLVPLDLEQSSLPAIDDTNIPAPASHGYMYGQTRYALADDPYPESMQAAARDGTLKPIDYTHQNSSYATAAGGVISTADNLATWIRALVTGEVFADDTQQRWLNALEAEDPDQPDGRKYGYGMTYQEFGENVAMYYHGGELPGFNSFMGHDLEHDVTLVIWTNLTLSPDSLTTANAMLPPILDEIYPGLALAS
jgi:D-alanyl-D-alanine carboxypeptidase